MHITFSPMRSDARLEIARAGDVLTINGEGFDFGPLAEGATLPAEAIDSAWFAGPVERTGGELRLVLLMPHGLDAPETTRFPAPVELAGDGPVAVPAWSSSEEGGENG